jgi:hypothetical protein
MRINLDWISRMPSTEGWANSKATRRPFLRITGGYRVQAVNVAEFSSRDGEAQVSAAVFTQTEIKARSERSHRGFDPSRCRDEAAQSDLGMSANCRADQFGVRNIY